MEEHLPPEGTTPVPAERVARERAVRHVVQVHPNDLVEPWWMNEALTRDYREILYKEWSLDLEDVDPAYVDELLPEGVTLVRRGTMLNSRKMECVFEMGEALAAVALARRRLWIGVAGRDLASAQHLLAAVEEAFPEPAPAAAEDDPRVNIAIWTHGDDSRAFRRLDVAAWADIESNYAPSTREASPRSWPRATSRVAASSSCGTGRPARASPTRSLRWRSPGASGPRSPTSPTRTRSSATRPTSSSG